LLHDEIPLNLRATTSIHSYKVRSSNL